MNTPFEKKVCYTLCCCELTAVLSCVFIFYLTFGIYLPAYRQINAGFSNETVMCTTVSNMTFEPCEVGSWASCGEWCLSKSAGGPCTQIRVNVRQNGTNVQLEGCDPEMEDVIYCDGEDPKQHLAECILGQCSDLTGLYNCSYYPVSPGVQEAAVGARCRDLSRVLACNLTSTDPGIQCRTKKSCLHLEGLYLCRKGLCARIRPPFQCEHTCFGIVTGGKSIIVRENNVVFTAKCKRAIEMETGEEIWPKNFAQTVIKSSPSYSPSIGYLNGSSSSFNDRDDGDDDDSYYGNVKKIMMTTSQPPKLFNDGGERRRRRRRRTINESTKLEPPMLVIFCTAILNRQTNSTVIRMLDCFNGTLMDPGHFGDQTDIRILTKAHTHNERLLDPTGQIAPNEADLILQHDAPLYINYEGCVNTLILSECEKFHAEYGVDGSDFRVNKRFPCYYRPDVVDRNDTLDGNFVILRYDIQRTILELTVASVVPTVLAIISCTLLVIFSKVIKIGDDQRFYLEMCGKTYKPDDVEMMAAAAKNKKK